MGPFRVLQVVGESNMAYKLALPPQMHIHPVFHVSLLEPYRENSFPVRVQPPPLPVEVEGEEEFEVRSILDSKKEHGRLLYLVDWEGYGPEERTWEPAAHMKHAPEAVANFHRRNPQRPMFKSANRPNSQPRRSLGPRRDLLS